MELTITKEDVAQMKAYAKELKFKFKSKDPKKMRVALLNHINELDKVGNKEIETWFNTQVELEEKAEEAKAQAEKVVKTKERIAKQKEKAKPDSEPKSQFGHRFSKQAGKIDAALKKGAMLEEIAKEADCTPARVRDHMKHLVNAHACEIETLKNGKLRLGACG